MFNGGPRSGPSACRRRPEKIAKIAQIVFTKINNNII